MNEIDHGILSLLKPQLQIPCINIIYLHIHGLIYKIDQHNDQLPVGLIAQLVEHYTHIVEVRVRISFAA